MRSEENRAIIKLVNDSLSYDTIRENPLYTDNFDLRGAAIGDPQ
jgi:hypothetical protein